MIALLLVTCYLLLAAVQWYVVGYVDGPERRAGLYADEGRVAGRDPWNWLSPPTTYTVYNAPRASVLHIFQENYQPSAFCLVLNH